MKRTFLVTVEGEDARKYWFEPAVILDHIVGNLEADASITVTETTATHAKEREILDRAKAWLTAIVVCDSNTNQSDDFGYAMDLERRQAELETAVRALMEGKG